MSEPPAWQAPGSSSPDQHGQPPAQQPSQWPPAQQPSQWPPAQQPSQWPPGGQPSPATPPVAPGGYGWGPPQYAPPAWTAPPRPGVVPLRPLGLGEILDGAVKTMRHNPRVMFGLSALVMGVAVLVSTLLLLLGLTRMLSAVGPTGDTVDAQQVAQLLSGGLVGVAVPAVVEFFALSVLNGVLILAVSEAVIGRRPDAGQVLRRVGWRGVGRLVSLAVLTGLIGLAVLVVVAGPVVLLVVLVGPAGVAAAVLAVPLLLALGVWLWTKLAFAAPALLLEQLSVTTALRRSWGLVRGSFWRIFGILLLTQLIGSAASGLLQLPFSVIGSLLGGLLGGGSDTAQATRTAVVASTLVTNVGAVLGTAVVAPFTAGVVSLLYIDLRIRREGLDVALSRAAAANAPTA